MDAVSAIRRIFPWLAPRQRVLALVGKSGTGKSFQARQVARRFRIDLIIDDGLLIRGQKIIAGRSAKREKGILTAIKTAVFANPELIQEVRQAIVAQRFGRLLILGTSRKMVLRIARTLDLLPIHRFIAIEEVSSRAEITQALKIRAEQGKHIIPVPAVEIKRSYPHIFFESVKILLKSTKVLRKSDAEIVEKTVVRPDYGRVKPASTDRTTSP
jgi:ABC-type dipeptide/oligopeptide/nickel transport system ATPase component